MLTWAIVTKEVEAEQRIWHLAHNDALTGLSNRAALHRNIQSAVEKPHKKAAVLFIDLDGFKLVNDSKGHGAGDQLLIEVSSRLRAICDVPGTEIGRLGGDEFAILSPQNNPQHLERLASRIISSLSEPYEFDDGTRLKIGTSIGIALAPQHGSTVEAILTRADIALYCAKAAGKGIYKVFSSDMERHIHDQTNLLNELRHSLATGQGLFVFYQPIVNARSKKVSAREALIRWHHPQRGWVSPAEFVPVAEQSEVIFDLGKFVLTTACLDAAKWDDNARVAVNISAAQLGRGTLAPTILEVLESTGLCPDRLEIEVTETAMLHDVQSCIGDLCRIRELGVRVALDDFGTGYSSLTHLRAFPFDKIKIDGSFVRDAVSRPEAAAVVRAVADLGKRLGVTTVAEGVETEAHLARVLAEGCVEVQGHLYGKPSPDARDAPAVAALDNRHRAITTGSSFNNFSSNNLEVNNEE
jgi:diguanylate cyclase (GGDEF)-like protein